VDISVDGLEDVNPSKAAVADSASVSYQVIGDVATGTARHMELGIISDQHVAFVDLFLDVVVGDCRYFGQLDEYAH
jgi:hypothetical protein